MSTVVLKGSEALVAVERLQSIAVLAIRVSSLRFGEERNAPGPTLVGPYLFERTLLWWTWVRLSRLQFQKNLVQQEWVAAV